jgi:hypothetical protein
VGGCFHHPCAFDPRLSQYFAVLASSEPHPPQLASRRAAAGVLTRTSGVRKPGTFRAQNGLTSGRDRIQRRGIVNPREEYLLHY